MIQDFFLISTTHWLLWIGITLLVLEVAFFGIATFVLFFIGLAMLVVAGLMGIEIIPGDPQTAIIAVSIVTLLSAAALWRPLRRLQSGTTNANNEVGFFGHRFQLEMDISPDKPGQYFYSGISWIIQANELIEKKTLVQVIHADVGIFRVKIAKA